MIGRTSVDIAWIHHISDAARSLALPYHVGAYSMADDVTLVGAQDTATEQGTPANSPTAQDIAEQILAVLKANPDVRALVFTPGAIVNNMSEYQDTLMHAAFECQYAFQNETKFRKQFLDDAVLAQTKSVARTATVKWNAEISKYQRIHKDTTWDTAVSALVEQDIFATMKAKSEYGEQVIRRLK